MPGMPAFRSDDRILAIGRALENRTLPKPDWTHAAHFAAALAMLSGAGETEVLRTMPGRIRAYNEATGVANTDHGGYHETITVASIRAAAWVLRTHGGRPLFEVLDLLMASGFGRPDWLLDHWTRQRLFSVEARRMWCDPDLRALPF